ncbi:hypothetical protein ACFFQW_16120 [Umezawaea endophytica]|uniref:Uncharacterized protein n=1 Tax=Umezawaea endophytica TaxID=1654476 RepID=A0A9X2VU37_9PSEU|nr:hypothetical protein [Umezawaea endophytica]MCS7481613.1 hypothetical protein [Umezawaea endophytica]
MAELTVVENLLGVPPGYPRWRVADMANRAGLLPTWLSSVVARGGSIGEQAAEHLSRVRRRVDALHATGERLARAHGVEVIKGARIAARMPAGLLRDSGDTDVVAPDEESLWRCVLDLRERFDAVPQGINVLQTREELHVVVAMKWPAEEPELDKPMGADIATCAFCGNTSDVPVRAGLPEDDDVRSLFAVAEECFQRRFKRKDVLDLVVLAEVLDERFGDRLPDLVADTARELNLAPELLKLHRRTSRWVDLPDGWAAVQAALVPVAADEKARRRSGTAAIPRLRFGFPLDDKPSAGSRVELHEFGDTHLMTTPIGTCLLVDDPNIPEDLHRAAVERVRLVAAG